MNDGFRYALLLAAGLVAVLFIILFTAWGLTTYGSVRHIVGDFAAQPDRAADLRYQYEDMVTHFAGDESSFTYYFQSTPIDIGRTQVAGMGESEVISLVLDTYASGLYDNNLRAGGLGAASAYVGSSGNLQYAVSALISAIAFILLTAGAILWFPDLSRQFKLKSAGKTIAAFCAVVFFIFALLPGLLKSIVWGSLANSSAVRDVLDIIEPVVVGSLLRNTLLVIIIAGILYAAGYWIETHGDFQSPFKSSRASAQKDRSPEKPKRRSL
jgi:hypothetical protein